MQKLILVALISFLSILNLSSCSSGSSSPLINPPGTAAFSRSTATVMIDNTTELVLTLTGGSAQGVVFTLHSSNPNIVKVVRNCHHNALYFSRSPIPAYRDVPVALEQVFRHIGLYAYRASFLLDSVHWPVCALESVEALEQLRVLWMGHAICVEEACVAPGQDINTAEDLERARHQLC